MGCDTGGVEAAFGAESVEHPLMVVDLADEWFAAAEDRSNAGDVFDDFEMLIAEFSRDLLDAVATLFRRILVEFIPFIGGADFVAVVADRDQPSTSSDSNVVDVP